MAFAETANLAVKLTLGGNFNAQLAKTRAGLKSLDRESRAFKAGGQIGTGIRRGALLAVAGVGALTALLIQSAKEGQAAANVQKIYAQAILKSGKVSKDYVKILDDQQTALMNLAGVDDEVIKAEQTKLIQFGLSGKAVAKLTPLILDAAKATGKDLTTVTIAAGKAANGNATALQKMGIFVDKARFKIDPLAETMRVLNQRFGGTTKALSGSLDTRLAALRENLANIREEAGIKLLPALTRIVDAVGTKLVPAFGKFIDRILPQIVDGMNQFADALENGGAESAIRGITDALGPMIELVKIAAAPVKAIVTAFLSLPKEIQTVLVGAFAVNKLTGGLVTNLLGGVLEGAFKAVKSMVVTAAVVTVNGPVTGLPGGGAPGGLPPAAAPPGGITLPRIGAGIAIEKFNQSEFESRLDAALGRTTGAVKGLSPHIDNVRDAQRHAGSEFKAALGAIEKRAKEQGKEPTQQQILATFRKNQARAEAHAEAARQKAAENIRATKSADLDIGIAGRNTAAAALQAGRITAGALKHLPVPTTNIKVNVSVTPGAVQKSTTIQTSYGPANGSSGGGGGSGNTRNIPG